MKEKQAMPWYNFTTKTHDYIVGLPENLTDYLEFGTARNLYYIYVEHKNMSPTEAFIAVSEIRTKIRHA